MRSKLTPQRRHRRRIRHRQHLHVLGCEPMDTTAVVAGAGTIVSLATKDFRVQEPQSGKEHDSSTQRADEKHSRLTALPARRLKFMGSASSFLPQSSSGSRPAGKRKPRHPRPNSPLKATIRPFSAVRSACVDGVTAVAVRFREHVLSRGNCRAASPLPPGGGSRLSGRPFGGRIGSQPQVIHSPLTDSSR
jgi:hypothetical protein